MSLPLSGSQTVGPYFAIGMSTLCSRTIAHGADEQTVVVEGHVFDSEGVAIPDALLEVWQANRYGRYDAGRASDSVEAAHGFGRIATDSRGGFRFTTIKPGPVFYDANSMQAPHLLVLVFMRGLLRNLVTRLYFPDEATNASDPILQLVPPERRSTLIATVGDQPGTLRWDIVMRQGAGGKPETVFFAW